MPIRTNRGRTAVYRRLWGWPLRSPRHLVGSLVVVAVLLTGIGIALPKVIDKPQGRLVAVQPSYTPPPSSPSAFPGLSPAPSSPMATRLSGSQTTPTSAAPNADGLRVAKDWAAAWVTHPAGITNQQWLARLRPFTTDEYLPVMQSVDPANVPGNAITGEPQVISSYTSSLQVVIPTDGPRLSITVVSTDAGWRVSDYNQAS